MRTLYRVMRIAWIGVATLMIVMAGWIVRSVIGLGYPLPGGMLFLVLLMGLLLIGGAGLIYWITLPLPKKWRSIQTRFDLWNP